jgi:hypothetical protein
MLAVVSIVVFVDHVRCAETEQEATKSGIGFQTDFYSVEVAPNQPALLWLTVDSLGVREFHGNRLRALTPPSRRWTVRRSSQRVEYRVADAPAVSPPCWSFEFLPRRIRICSTWSSHSPGGELALDFNSLACHATLLGRMLGDGRVQLPALIHIPSEGTFRVTVEGVKDAALGYSSRRFDDDFVKATFPAATKESPRVTYDLEVIAIYPEVDGIEGDTRYDGFRRGWLNILQLNPKQRALANHAASDSCAFTLYEYSEIAMRTPPLAEGLTALDMLRQTLDRYLEGMPAYGLSEYDTLAGPHVFLDSYPSLLISAWNYARGSEDTVWLASNYDGIQGWASGMLAMDRDGNGLIEYPLSGNSGSWPEKVKVRPSNWWDTIGFGHEDAYSNALAYHACLAMADMANRVGERNEERRYRARAEKLHDAYFKTFYNPDTGVLAGWKSADGKLHDYYFTFVNGMAITYGLVPEDKANGIMDRLLAKMEDVGYDRFEFGLPGNLIPIRREDYVHLEKRWGGPQREDGSDAFQIYENGGASACFVYYTLQALYDLGRDEDASRILFPLLDGFRRRGFQGVGPNERTYDWKAWDGTPHGYEGFLVDNYLTFLVLLTRHRTER